MKNPDAGNPLSGNAANHPSWNPAAHPFLRSQSQTPSSSQSQQTAATSSAKTMTLRTVCIAIALCDTGATYTLMSSQLASIVAKKVVGKRRLRIETLGDVLDGEFNEVEVTARGVNIANTFTFQAVVISNLTGVFERVAPESYLALQEVVGGLPILADLAGPGADNIGIVFGEDCYDSIVQGMTLKLRNGLKGTPTIFGWILHGGDRCIPIADMAARAHAYAFRASVQDQIQNFWTLDHLGVTSDEMLEGDLEPEVKNTIKRNESGKFVVSWPWKAQARKNLALNKVISETSLRRMVKRMTPEEYPVYDNQTILQEGHIE